MKADRGIAGNVVFHQHLGVVGTAGQGGDGAPHIGFVVVEAGLRHLGKTRVAVDSGELGQTALTGTAARHLGPQVTLAGCRITDIGVDNVEGGLVGPAFLVEPQRRQNQSFGVEFDIIRALAAWHFAADVHVMGDGRSDGNELAVMEHRREQADVHGVGAALVGVVADDDVAWLPCIARDGLEDVADRRRHDAELGRDSFGLGQHVAVGREQAAGVVVHVPDDR